MTKKLFILALGLILAMPFILFADEQGNITFLYRMNEVDLDMLYLTYEGNQLIQVDDDAGDRISYSAKHYVDGENAQKEMFYDKNGALTADLDRKICAIQNNLLTLPDTRLWSAGKLHKERLSP